MEIEVELERGYRKFFAGAFMDKKPLLLVGTCGTSLPADPVVRQRVEFHASTGFVRSSHEVTQPMVHDLYRRHFNGVDLFNRDALGEHSL